MSPPATNLANWSKSFNSMAAEMETSRDKIDASTRELAVANVEIEERRRHLETILETIPTGVLSLDARGSVTRINTAFRRLVRLSEGYILSFDHDPGRHLSGRRGARPRAHAAACRPHGYHHQPDGDLDAARATQRCGDRLVARSSPPQFRPAARLRDRRSKIFRISKGTETGRLAGGRAARGARDQESAHANRARGGTYSPPSGSWPAARTPILSQVIENCSETISGSVETLRNLVDQFSALARFPASQPQPLTMNQVVESALVMFEGRLEGIRLQYLPRARSCPK